MGCEAFFEELGLLIRADWAALNFDEASFSEIAERHLRRRPPASHLTLTDIVEFSLLKRERHIANPNGDFGQPNITLYEGSHFFIEALVWLEGTTSVHQHSFSGAFAVMHGGSVHSQYAFAATRRFNTRLHFGQLTNTNIEILKAGDVRRIEVGSSLIHSLFHLEYPSVSIVVRTSNDRSSGIQYSYLQPGVAFDPFHRRASQTLALRTFAMLEKIRSPERDRLLVHYLRQSDVHEAFDLLHSLSQPEDVRWYATILGQLTQTPYADAIDVLHESLTRRFQELQVLSLRYRITDAELRLLLGVLLNAPNLAAAYALLRSKYADREPKEVLLDAMRRLAVLDIGLPGDDSTIDLLSCLLDGGDDDAVLDRLADEYGADEVAAMRPTLEAAVAVLRRHYLFANLLRPTADTRPAAR